jgi:hypothetical protein
MPLSWTVESPWEDYFTVMPWDQRGAGKTYMFLTENLDRKLRRVVDSVRR